jgi:hypothetical protein
MIPGVAPPQRIPIKHEVDYRTDQIGHHAQGQFLGGVIGEYLGGWRSGMSREDLRWYAYLHHFDRDGTYLCSDIEFVGVNVEGQAEVVARAEALLAQWLSQLDDLVYGDWVELYPDRLGFHAPWNGEYDT